MATLVDYKGLKVLTPNPTGAGGRAINDDLKLLADRVAANPFVQGLTPAWANATTIRLARGAALSSDGALDLTLTSPVDLSLTIVGIGGLDAGPLARSTAYSIYVIGDASGALPPAALMSINANAPLMPAGYNRHRRVGCAAVDASGQLVRFHTTGLAAARRIHFAEARTATQVLAAGNATAFTSVSCAAFAPAYVRVLQLHVALSASAAAGSAFFRLAGDTHDGSLYEVGVAGPGQRATANFELPCSANQRFEYRVSDPQCTLDVSVVGMIDELSA